MVWRFLSWVVWNVLTIVSLCTMVIGAQIVGMTQDPQSTDMVAGIAMLAAGATLTTMCIAGIVRWVLGGTRGRRGPV